MDLEVKKNISIDAINNYCIQSNLIFASYRHPGDSFKKTIVQEGASPKEIDVSSDISNQKGFIVSPFLVTDKLPTYLIKPDIFFDEDDIDYELYQKLHAISAKPDTLSSDNGQFFSVKKEEYIRVLNKTLREIYKGGLDKVVLSRIKKVHGNFQNHVLLLFNALCELRPNAFVYMFRVDGHFWLGATPEPLISLKNDVLTTVSLAATHTFDIKYLDLKSWSHKEIIEQEYVTQFIEKILLDFNVKSCRKIGPYAKKAGELVHLRTDFKFNIEQVKDSVGELILALHPTSAICGMPKYKALEFILENEKHERDFYAGFLGPVNLDTKLALFVNLRCMRLLKNNLLLFVGGGITNESVPEDEWEETNMKADTILSVIKKIKKDFN